MKAYNIADKRTFMHFSQIFDIHLTEKKEEDRVYSVKKWG